MTGWIHFSRNSEVGYVEGNVFEMKHDPDQIDFKIDFKKGVRFSNLNPPKPPS